MIVGFPVFAVGKKCGKSIFQPRSQSGTFLGNCYFFKTYIQPSSLTMVWCVCVGWTIIFLYFFVINFYLIIVETCCSSSCWLLFTKTAHVYEENIDVVWIKKSGVCFPAFPSLVHYITRVKQWKRAIGTKQSVRESVITGVTFSHFFSGRGLDL